MNANERECHRPVTARQRHILRHALGLDHTGREYRNRYCPGGADVADCAALEEAGLMTSHELAWIPDRTYHVTEAGRDVARAEFQKEARAMNIP